MSKWMVYWVESGTGERIMRGPLDTEEQARREPFTKLYPPVTATIQVWQVADDKVSA